MTQPRFDDLPAAVHGLDPASSHAAIAEHTLSGRRQTHMARVLAEVRLVEGCTASELAARTQLDVVEVRRRLTDLKLRGDVRRGDLIRAGGARKEVTWWPA